jgi:hypothetical protein
MKQKLLQAMFAVLLGVNANAQVNSGSNGSDGVFNPATNTVINMADHPNGIYQYASVTISNGVTVTFIPNANNTPVTWLVQSNVVINGTVDVSGQNLYGSRGGPGGWAGGIGGNNPTSGQGPGGGTPGYISGSTNFYGGQASFGTAGAQGIGDYGTHQATPGVVYGNTFLIPLVGGSGGGGGYNADNAGSGGGAILIAANNQISITGNILANGGDGFISCGYNCYSSGAGGSGGAIRLVATTILGGGTISANGGAGLFGRSFFDGISGGNPQVDSAGSGRIRFDTFQDSFNGQVNGVFTQGYQPIIIPVTGQGIQLTIASVGGASVSATPNGQLFTPDALISGQQANPIPVVVNCLNLPLNTLITVTVKPTSGSSVSAVGYNTTGTLASSTATVLLNVPRGGGLIYASAATSN